MILTAAPILCSIQTPEFHFRIKTRLFSHLEQSVLESDSQGFQSKPSIRLLYLRLLTNVATTISQADFILYIFRR